MPWAARSSGSARATASGCPAAGSPAEAGRPGRWTPDPHEAIVLLHGWSGSIAPHLVEYGPFLRRTAGVLGLDFRGHGDSDDSPTTFGLREVEDIAGALAWLGERGIERVALVGMSMGGISAIAAVAVLGDGSLVGTRRRPVGSGARRRRRCGRGSWPWSGTRWRPSCASVAVPLIPRTATPASSPDGCSTPSRRTLGADPRDDRAGARDRAPRGRRRAADPGRRGSDRAGRRRAPPRRGRPGRHRAVDRAGRRSSRVTSRPIRRSTRRA